MGLVIITAGIIGLTIAAFIIGWRNAGKISDAYESGYLAGHVDGYGKALHDAGVPE
jgi:hypothetical protein